MKICPRNFRFLWSSVVQKIKKPLHQYNDYFQFGGDEGIRTPGLLHAKQALSQLSHTPTEW